MITLTVPGSKSWINRFLLLACFADTPSTCWGFNACTDCVGMVDALRAFGHGIEVHEDHVVILPGKWCHASINAADAGSVARFLTPVASWLGHSEIKMTPMLAQRPMGEGLMAVRFAGGNVDFVDNSLRFDWPMVGDAYRVTADHTTQFATGFLLLAAGISGSVEILGDVSSPAYLDLTRKMIAEFQVRMKEERGYYRFAGRPRGCDRTAEIDLSGGVALLAGLVLSKKHGVLKGWNHATVQAEGFLPELLSESGLDLEITDTGLEMKPGDFGGFSLETKSCPDAVPALAIMALAAKSPSVFHGATYLETKESNRLEALLEFSKQSGLDMSLNGEDLLVKPGVPSDCELATRQDHRLVMAGMLMNLMNPSINVLETSSIDKSFPRFLDQLSLLRGSN